MSFSRVLADQLGNPTGMYGKFAAFVWNRRNAALNDRSFDALSLQPTDRVLDIGFGGGYLIQRMTTIVTDGLLAGVDKSPAMVADAAKRFKNEIKIGRLELKCATAEALPYPAEHFKKVCSVNSIFYWQDVEQGLREVMRVLIKGGTAVFCFTDKASLEKKGFAKYVRLFEIEELEQMMTENGFQDPMTSSFSDKYRRYNCTVVKKLEYIAQYVSGEQV
jgi:ubiquinone/menaquinone biosynthesis C-methylase UbiE